MPLSTLPHRRTRLILVAATLVSGILAGGVIDRVIVGGPAWHALGATAWVHYSRHADLGTGVVAYPIEGIGSAVLAVAATCSSYLDGDSRRGAMIPLYLGAAFSVIGLLLTIKAAPIMLALGKTQPADAIQRAFKQFFFWGLYVRGSADALAFFSEVWALSALYGEKD